VNGRPIRRALISVYDKTSLGELARGLHHAGVALIATGSTAVGIAAAGVPVTEVSELTGFPECLDGRVKTLHPVIHAGILADRRRPDHVQQLADLGIDGFDLVVGNLYPFRETIAAGANPEECIEQIDIGGPAMIRAAAKNHATVVVVVDPAQYPEVIAAAAGGGTDLAYRRGLAAAAFEHTAAYDAAVATWCADTLTGGEAEGGSGPPEGTETFLGSFLGLALRRTESLRYGENPHQRAAVYRDLSSPHPGVASAVRHHGKAMSYNNYVDADAGWRTVGDFTEPCVAIIKHANPCGIACAAVSAIGSPVDAIAAAHRAANACDPVSAFGGVIAANRTVTIEMARQVVEIFTEVIIAPSYEPAALAVLMSKPSLRIVECEPSRGGVGGVPLIDFRNISGGVLAQTADHIDAPGDDPARWQLVAGSAVDDATMNDLMFAWRAIRSVKSNAILLASDLSTVGVGMGQVNRVDSARLAVERAGDRAVGSVAASDAFFPFADGVMVLLDAGVRAIVQPGGSMRDAEVVAAAEAAGTSMYCTGTRHFFH
jgi:phosphoribosylaminoimidazolecarboxamide formyltransferase / IMP cyclohydrolase